MDTTVLAAPDPDEPDRPDAPYPPGPSNPTEAALEDRLRGFARKCDRILAEERRSELEPVVAALLGMTTELRRVADALQPTPACGAGRDAPNALGNERCTLDAGHHGRHGDGLTSWPNSADEGTATAGAEPGINDPEVSGASALPGDVVRDTIAEAVELAHARWFKPGSGERTLHDTLADAVLPVIEQHTAQLREKHTAALRHADDINNALMEEVQRYAAGTEQPVLWSVYNDMHKRAITAEAEKDELHAALGLAPGQLHSAALSAIRGRGSNIRELAERAEQAEAAVARVRAFAEDMRTWCSPHDVATEYANRLLAVLDEPPEPLLPGNEQTTNTPKEH